MVSATTPRSSNFFEFMYGSWLTLNMAVREIQNFEVETQFFGFNPLTIVDLAINAVNDAAIDGAEDLRKKILQQNEEIDEDELLRVLLLLF